MFLAGTQKPDFIVKPSKIMYSFYQLSRVMKKKKKKVFLAYAKTKAQIWSAPSFSLNK